MDIISTCGILFTLLLQVSGKAVDGTVVTRDSLENASITFRCDHSAVDGSISAIVWEDAQKPIAVLQPGSGLGNVKDALVGRVTISYPEGDLMMSEVGRDDSGLYKCVVIIRGVREDRNRWYKLNVLVPPENLQIKCSGSLTEQPTEDCSVLKKDEIRSIQCEVTSNPVSTLVYSEAPENCKARSFGTTQTGDFYGSRKLYGLRSVCEGTYCCHAQYDHGGVLINNKVCVDIGNVVYTPTSESQVSTRNLLLTVAVPVGIFLVLVILTLACCCYCIRYQRRHNEYPCGVKYVPCMNTCCNIHNKPGKAAPTHIEIRDTNGVETSTALTPFLGPNHVVKNNVFDFVIDKAQENPNVSRVKVTHENDPAGDTCRTVEIYKDRDNDFLLPNDERVQPGLFRRALSNSDVSKIVYTETMDDSGKMKREIDIIKGYPKTEETNNIEESDYLLHSTGVSLSPPPQQYPAGGYPMNSLRRQLSKIPAMASETDVRKPVLQRQLTIERSRDNLLKNTGMQRSVDIEEVD